MTAALSLTGLMSYALGIVGGTVGIEEDRVGLT
jgi:hypothetical protein